MLRRKLLMIAIPLALKGETAIVGRWRSVTTTKGGIGAVYDFQANGKAQYSSAALVDMAYQVDGNYLKMEGQTIGFGFHPDGRLQLNFGKVLEDYKRIGVAEQGSNKLVGEWAGLRDMGGIAVPSRFIFRNDGTALMVMLIKTTNGMWKDLASGAWTMTMPSMPSRKITAEGKQLVIQVTGGDPHRFNQF